MLLGSTNSRGELKAGAIVPGFFGLVDCNKIDETRSEPADRTAR